MHEHEGNDIAVFHSRTPMSDFINTTSRLSTITNVGYGEPGMTPLDQPGEAAARMQLNRISSVSLVHDVEWGGPSRKGPTVRDAAMTQKYLEATSIRNRTMKLSAVNPQAAAPRVLPLRR